MAALFALVSVLVPVSLATAADAGSAPPTVASGTLSCSFSKGTLTVSPGLMFGGTASSATFTFAGKLGCSGYSGIKGGEFTATGTSDSNNCSVLASQGIPQMTGTIDWKGHYDPTGVVFSDGNFSIASSVSINLPSLGPNPPTGTTTVSGSFADEPIAATFIADQSVATFADGCNNTTTGLTGFTFDGTNGASTVEISQQQTVNPPPPPPSGPVTVGVDASSPGATVNEDLVGVNHITSGSQGAMAAIGATWARTDVSFEVDEGTSQAAYNCTTGIWNPSYLDGNVALDQEAGAQVQLIVDYFPSCIDWQLPGLSAATVKADHKAWKNLVYQMALHEIGAEGVRTFEVWNEPSFYMPLNGPNGYLALYNLTVPALEKAAAKLGVSIEVGGPGVDELGQIDNTWIAALAADVVKRKLPLDFISWHQYPNDPDEGPQAAYPNGICDTGNPQGGQPCWYNPDLDITLFSRGAAAVQSLLTEYPSLHPLLWVDEWGIDSGNDARINGPYGAAFVAASLDDAQQGGIDRMSYYDAADDPTDPTYSNFGLLNSSLEPKPLYYAFGMWNQLAGSLLPVTLDPDQSASGPVGQIGSVASVAPDGTVHVMVYNFAPYDASGVYGTTDPTPFDHQVTVNLSGLGASSYTMTRTLIDGENTDATVDTEPATGPSASFTFELAGEGVTMLTFTPTS